VTAEAEARLTPRGPLRLLIDPVFGGIFWGKLLSSAGVWVHSIVAAIVVFDATGSALMVGLVSVAQFAPQLVLTPLSGMWADRGHAARQILVGRVLCVIGSGSLALWMWLVPDAGDALVTVGVLSASLLVGLGFVVGGPAMQSIVPSLIRPGELSTAMALNTAPMTTSRIAGPAIGAFVAAHLGADAAFGIAAATHLFFVVMIVLVRFPVPRAHRAGVDYSVRAALRHVRRDRPLLLLLLAITAVGFGAEPSMTLAPAMAEELDGSAQVVGELSAGFGVGAAIGLIIVSSVNRRIRSTMSSTIGLWFMAIGLVLVSISPTVGLAFGAFGVAGFGFSWAMTGVSTLIQERAPDELRGRIMALWMVGFIGSRPVAAATLGAAADVLSVRAALVITAVLLGLVALVCRPRVLADPLP
jgi:MFS family permease